MSLFLNRRLLPLLLFALSCSGKTEQQVINNPVAISSESAIIPTGALIISGSIANGEDPSNTAVIKGQEVAILRNDGVIVAQGISDDQGDFEFNIAEGGLIVDSSFSKGIGLESNPDQATVDDFSYTLQAKIPDDGTGRALGLRRKIAIAEGTAASTGTLNLGSNPLKEVTAIIGKIAFADANVSLAGVDAFIPGKPFFVRTGDDGAFSLLFIPSGSYNIRVTKGFYIKDVPVVIEPGKTTDLGTVTVGSAERNPLPLASVLPGKWLSTCYYDDVAGGVSADNPKTGTITLTSLTQMTIIGSSCLLRTMGTPDSFTNFDSLRLLGDGAIIAKFGTASFFYSQVSSYSNNQIVLSVDNKSLASGRIIEIWNRTQ